MPWDPQDIVVHEAETQGTWSVTDHALKTTTVYVAGSRWRMPPKGTKVTITNPGNVPAVQWVYRLIEK